MSSFKPLEASLTQSWPPAAWADISVLLAVSGGADSMALLRAMARLKEESAGRGTLSVAHFNHSLRGTSSDQDQQLVLATCEALGLDCHLGKAAGPGKGGHPEESEVSELARQQGDGIEAAARDARYRFLTQKAESLGARYVVTAHTANDQVETILHRILRGTGLSGLSGIPRVRSLGPAISLIRPLLGISRDQIEVYLKSVDQPSRMDKSNTDLAFTRNRIRRELLPWLQANYNPKLDEALLRLGTLAGESQLLIVALAHQLLERALVERWLLGEAESGSEVSQITLRVEPLCKESCYLVREAIKHVWHAAGWPQQAMGYAAWDQIASLAFDSPISFVQSQSGRRAEIRLALPGNIVAKRDADYLTLRRSG